MANQEEAEIEKELIRRVVIEITCQRTIKAV
jgi:hypothetical protein